MSLTPSDRLPELAASRTNIGLSVPQDRRFRSAVQAEVVSGSTNAASSSGAPFEVNRDSTQLGFD